MSRNPKGPGARRRRGHKKALLAVQGYVCALRTHPQCPGILTYDTATLDHIVEMRNGGTNARSNLQVACAPCNWSKSPHLDKKRRWNRVGES